MMQILEFWVSECSRSMVASRAGCVTKTLFTVDMSSVFSGERYFPSICTHSSISTWICRKLAGNDVKFKLLKIIVAYSLRLFSTLEGKPGKITFASSKALLRPSFRVYEILPVLLEGSFNPSGNFASYLVTILF